MDNAVLVHLPAADRLPPGLRADLRSDHAGEAGAVAIYRSLITFSRDPEVQRFARAHLATEQRHLALFEHWLTPDMHSHILPLWRLSGWILGLIAALGGRRLVFAIIEAVETFVVEHYQQQLDALPADTHMEPVRALLAEFQHDEGCHRDDASTRQPSRTPSLLIRLWTQLIADGSRLAVLAARRI